MMNDSEFEAYIMKAGKRAEECRKEINNNIDSCLWPYTWRIRRVWWAILRTFYRMKNVAIEKK